MAKYMAHANMTVSLFRAKACNALYTSRLRCIVTPFCLLCVTDGAVADDGEVAEHLFTLVQ